jgi:hypothetical protein
MASALASGCATWNPPADTSDAQLRTRAVSLTSRDVRVSAAVLSRADAVRMFGVDVYEKGVQFGGKTNVSIDDHFDRLAMRGAVPAGKSSSGILFTTPQPITKFLNVDLLGDGRLIPFTLFVPVPDGANVTFEQQIHPYASDEITRCDDELSLRKALAALPCCGQPDGDGVPQPVNMVVVGTLADLGAAAVRRGYRRAMEPEAVGQRLFGRAPDFVIRKHAQGGSSANWLRVWRAPVEYLGQYVFVLQAGRPVGGRFAAKGAVQRLHADVDEARNLVVQDLLYSGSIVGLGFDKSLQGSGSVPAGSQTTAPYRTDGLRAVLLFGTRPQTFSDVRLLEWEPLSQTGVERDEPGTASHD